MFTESAGFYDAIYKTFKNYDAEAAAVVAVAAAEHPSARTLLDVACGTGEHARVLTSRHGLDVDGLDLDPAMLELARQKVPGARFFEADMADFHLGRRYDVVTCLFSSIGYLRTLDRVTSALRCFREHLAPVGMVIVEPWFAPGVLEPGVVSTNVGETAGMRIERSSRIEVLDGLSRLIFDYRIEDRTGARHAAEVHELGLFTDAEMRAAFEDAGLTVRHDPVGLSGRGLYVARARA